MLGLYEWGIGNSYKAFRLVGDAIRMTQAMGLAAEPKVADEQLVSSSVSYSKTQATDRSPQDRIRAHKGYNARDISVQEEIRIRTFWSCFIMDRYLSSGQPSLQMFDVEKLRIRLPCSEIDFLSKRRVLTESFTAEARGGVRVVSQSYGQRNSRQSSAEPWPLLPQRSKPVPKSFRCQRDQALGRGLDRKVDHEQYDQENVKCQTGPNESVLSRVMMIIEIWGRVAKWSCEGGRR